MVDKNNISFEKQKLKIDYTSSYILPFIYIFKNYISIVIAENILLVINDIFLQDKLIAKAPLMYIYFWVPLVIIFFLFLVGVHERFVPFWDVLKKYFYGLLYALVFITFAVIIQESSHEIIDYKFFLGMGIFLVITYISICVFRQLFIKLCNYWGILKEPVIFINAGSTTEKIIKFLGTNSCIGFKVLGIVDENFHSDYLANNFRLLKNIDKAKRYIEELNIKTVIIAAPKMNKYKLVDIINQIQPVTRNILFVPDLIGIPVANLELKRLYMDNILLLNVRNNLSLLKNKIAKRIFDIVLGLLICIPVVPILVLLSIWVRLDSKGPIFFNAKRIGRDGKEFTCYKFRSMHMNADKLLKDYLAKNPEAKAEWDEFQKLKDYDPRVTKAGKIMRKLSLDELPQIFNVLKGEMSLVGPRPYLPREIEKMGTYYAIIIKTVPGITGFWQVNGRSDVSFAGRLKMDDWYIRNWSVWIDIVLLFKTIKVVFFGKGAV